MAGGFPTVAARAAPIPAKDVMGKRSPHRYNSRARERLRREMFCDQDGRCHLCDGPMTLRRVPGAHPSHTSDDFASFDHIKPFSEGGTAERSNLALAHKLCNLRRGTKDPLLC